MFEFLHCLAVSVPVGLVSLTISKASIFTSFRQWVGKKSTYWGEAVNCTFCSSFLVAIGAQLVAPSSMPISDIPYVGLVVNFIAGWLTVVSFSAVTSGMVYRMHAVNDVPAQPDSNEEDIELLTKIEQWLGTNPGESAKAMMSLLTGLQISTNAADKYPTNDDGYSQCRQLLKDFPQLTEYISRLELYSGWKEAIQFIK